MNYLDLVKLMRRHGFEPIRLYTNYEVWGKGDKQISVPYLQIIHRSIAKEIVKQIYA